MLHHTLGANDCSHDLVSLLHGESGASPGLAVLRNVWILEVKNLSTQAT
ncbi:hypothetical protein TRIP_E210003 [uncultured Spirochaetota bacterium]|nr:hypothetical protein TRIP_E210003 [uncultured Spirochaetota bacterium]